MTTPFKTWQCINCGFIYSEEEGLPDEGIAAGTRWGDVPEDFECPLCGFDLPPGNWTVWSWKILI